MPDASGERTSLFRYCLMLNKSFSMLKEEKSLYKQYGIVWQGLVCALKKRNEGGSETINFYSPFPSLSRFHNIIQIGGIFMSFRAFRFLSFQYELVFLDQTTTRDLFILRNIFRFLCNIISNKIAYHCSFFLAFILHWRSGREGGANLMRTKPNEDVRFMSG